MSISTLRRQVKNVALNYTDAQVKVREATSNDPWGPTTALMSEIADMTHNPMQFTEIMSMIWKRLNDHGKNWRHVYKSLVLLDYLIKCGSDRVAAQCKENIFSIETLKDFQHIEDNRDQGLNVRTKAKQMVALLADEEKLKNERARFMLTRKRFMQNGSSGISSDGRRAAGSRHRAIDAGPVDPEFEEARPSSLGEEEMQLQIALALSKEECEKEQELRRGDDIRLQIALEESKKEAMARSSSLGSPGGLDASQKPSTSKSQGALDDLLSLGLDEIFNNQQQQQTAANSAAAAGPSTSAQALMMPQNDPWSPRPSTTIPMVGGAGGGAAPTALNSFSADPPLYPTLSAQNDPWASPESVIPPPHPSMAAKGTSKELEDILGMSSSNNVSTGPSVPPAQNDPWAAFDNPTAQTNSGANSSLSGMAGGGGANQRSESANIGQQRGNVKTPESSFLGENSALVNLDNLLGPSINKEQPKKAATNPFLIGSAASAASASKNNPFLANERPSPSLNEMMQQAKHGNTNGNENGGNSTTNAGGQSSSAAAAPTHQNSPFGPDGSLI